MYLILYMQMMLCSMPAHSLNIYHAYPGRTRVGGAVPGDLILMESNVA